MQGKNADNRKNTLYDMRIERKRYLQRLVNSRKNGQIKIITGVRRCGKSYLLGVLYRDYLLQSGILPEQIISIELDNDINLRYRNPLELGSYLREKVSDTDKDYYKKNCIALLVELGEFINETKCFKYWSIKKPDKEKVLELANNETDYVSINLNFDKQLLYVVKLFSNILSRIYNI